MKEHILIVTCEYDPHADALVRLLSAQGHQPTRIHTADIPCKTGISVCFQGNEYQCCLETTRGQVDLTLVRSVWWRRPAQYMLPDQLTKEEKHFARLELDVTLQGMWDSLECYWMSKPANIRQATCKPGQLRRASKLGLDIPKTLITTDPEEAREFYKACDGNIVYKVLSDPTLGFAGRANELMAQCRVDQGPGKDPIIDWTRVKARITYTTRVEPAHLAMLDTIRYAPCQFQENVPKQYELRVTIIGDDIFVAEIHSQQHASTRLDWRHYDAQIPYRKGRLPPQVEDACMALTKGYGLNYGAIDLILTPEGRYIFLEINPNGQWLWVEQLIPELKMKEALAAQLVRGGGTLCKR
jgi:hypothetical protein